MPRPFLTARWQDLLLVNYDVPQQVLAPYLPAGVELDLWQGRSLASLVGFMFCDTVVRGIRLPGHQTFEEVNLRFYVRRAMSDGTYRRGVVFIRELVPRRLIAWVARVVYNEPYSAVRMSHRVEVDSLQGGDVEYGWRWRGEAYALCGKVAGQSRLADPGSEAEFITEHYWGYNRQRSGATLEYQVEHPSWHLWDQVDCQFAGDGGRLYGEPFRDILAQPPRSAMLAQGSEVTVYPGQRIA